MVRKLAVAAAVIGACALITPSFGKGGGFVGGFHAAPRAGLAPNFARPPLNMRVRPPLYTGLAPNFVGKLHRLDGRHFRFADRLHRRHHRRALGLGLGLGLGFAAAAVVEPVIYAVPVYEEPAPGTVALWRGGGTGGCSAETVQVRGMRGMDEVTITRC
jgi:hypothetical protein